MSDWLLTIGVVAISIFVIGVVRDKLVSALRYPNEVFRCGKCLKVFPISERGGKQILKEGVLHTTSLSFCKGCIE